MTEMTLERRAAMATLLADRPQNLFVVPGLGSTTWDAAAAAGSASRWRSRRRASPSSPATARC